jgi:hypothetical protein
MASVVSLLKISLPQRKQTVAETFSTLDQEKISTNYYFVGKGQLIIEKS